MTADDYIRQMREIRVAASERRLSPECAVIATSELLKAALREYGLRREASH